MNAPRLHVVTGALGYSGRHLATRLLASGARVRTLTGHPLRPDPHDGRVEIHPLDFDDPAALRDSLRGAAVLYNTYWIRFEHGRTTFDQAVCNNQTLIQAAVDAGVERVVHVSITQPSLDSPLPYFRGKAVVERSLRESGLSYAILRPTVFFGGRDVLINNIAWLLRRSPVYAVGGDGAYRVQPIHVDDFARLAEEHGRRRDDVTIDAVGPETFTFDELVRLVRRAVGSRAPVLHAPWWLVYTAGKVLGWWLRDVLLTRDEIAGLSANLLVSPDPPTGSTCLTEWLAGHAHELGVRYASELGRHFRR